MQRRLAAIFIADMVEYSRHMEADQTGTVGLISDLRQRWLEPVAEKHGGHVLKRMGDGWIIAFGSVTDAIEAAQKVQTSLAPQNNIQLRIAVHLGEILDDGADIYGMGLNIAARLQTEAPPGGVMISGDLLRQLEAPLAAQFVEAGDLELKNIAHPVQAYQWRPSDPGKGGAGEVPVIAVEPVRMSPDTPELADAARDFQDQLLVRLSRRTGIRAIAAGEKGQTEPTYTLRGSLRGGDLARLTLSLVVRDSGRVLWSTDYEGPGSDLFGLTDQAVSSADSALRLEINARDAERIDMLPDEALSASELRARAAQSFYSTTIEGYQRGVALLERSLRFAPGNAMALAMWAHGQTRLIRARHEEGDPELVSEIISRADAAVQAEPRSDFVCKVQGEVRIFLQGDIAGARRCVERVARINPNYTILKEVEANIALAERDFDKAHAVVESGMDQRVRDPFRPGWLYTAAVADLLAGRNERALAEIEEAIDRRPRARAYWLLQAEICRRMGDMATAARAEKGAAELPGDPDILSQMLVLNEQDKPLMALIGPD